MRREVARLIWLETGLMACGVALFFWMLRWRSASWAEVVYPTWGDTAWGTAVAGLMLLFGVATSKLVKQWVQQMMPLLSCLRPWEIVLLAVLAGFGEEILFRGVLQEVIGILASSLLFAVAHVWRWDVEALKVTFVYLCYSLMLGVLYLLTQNLWSSCVAHTLYDCVALIWFRYYLSRR